MFTYIANYYKKLVNLILIYILLVDIFNILYTSLEHGILTNVTECLIPKCFC